MERENLEEATHHIIETPQIEIVFVLNSEIAAIKPRLAFYRIFCNCCGPDEKLARVLEVLDEISAVAHEWATLDWRVCKFGVTHVLAGQNFRKEVVGAIKESLVGSTMVFQLATANGLYRFGLKQVGKWA